MIKPGSYEYFRQERVVFGKPFTEALREELSRLAATRIFVVSTRTLSRKTPVVDYRRLHEIGFKIISYSGLLQRTAIKGMQKALGVLREQGSAESLHPEHVCSLIDRSELLGLDRFYKLEERLYGPLLDSEKSWRAELDARSGASATDDRLPI